jgi:hypothetical protein
MGPMLKAVTYQSPSNRSQETPCEIKQKCITFFGDFKLKMHMVNTESYPKNYDNDDRSDNCVSLVLKIPTCT